MLVYDKKIPIPEIAIKQIISSIQDGEFSYWEQEQAEGKVTHNGRAADIWNHINTQVKRNLNPKRYVIDVVDRGNLWSFIYIYDLYTNYLYILMRIKNYKTLSLDADNKIYHYCNELSYANSNLMGNYQIEYEQNSCFVNTSRYDSEVLGIIESRLNEMLPGLIDKIDTFCMILFEQKNRKMKHIEAKIPILGFESIYTEDWSDFIKAEYTTEFVPVEITIPADNEILLEYRALEEPPVLEENTDNQEKHNAIE